MVVIGHEEWLTEEDVGEDGHIVLWHPAEHF